jgi:hypothetical protein
LASARPAGATGGWVKNKRGSGYNRQFRDQFFFFEYLSRGSRLKRKNEIWIGICWPRARIVDGFLPAPSLAPWPLPCVPHSMTIWNVWPGTSVWKCHRPLGFHTKSSSYNIIADCRRPKESRSEFELAGRNGNPKAGT